jgi:bifunctional DNA-binding transcriptional regulator/antitoxin component of YhaV-PrlF toxin-antitoxin module
MTIQSPGSIRALGATTDMAALGRTEEKNGGRAPGTRSPSRVEPFREREPAAHRIVAALALPTAVSAPPSGPPPLPSLRRLPRDASMLYGIGRVDSSGRVANREIVTALRWKPGDTVDLTLTNGAIILRASPGAHHRVQEKPRIVIPTAARRRHALDKGSLVLLAAAPEFGAVIVYPISALDDMIVSYHSAGAPGEPHGHG